MSDVTRLGDREVVHEVNDICSKGVHGLFDLRIGAERRTGSVQSDASVSFLGQRGYDGGVVVVA